MKKLYLAGSLFSSADISQRIKEANELRKIEGLEIFNPIESPFNDKSVKPTSATIFNGDTIEILKSDVIFADLSNFDVGVCMELGIAYGVNFLRKELVSILNADTDEETKLKMFNHLLTTVPKKDVVSYISDIRTSTANNYEGIHIPVGANQYVVGGVESMGIIVNSPELAIEKIKELKEKNV